MVALWGWLFKDGRPWIFKKVFGGSVNCEHCVLDYNINQIDVSLIRFYISWSINGKSIELQNSIIQLVSLFIGRIE